MKYFLGVIFSFVSLFGGWKVMASPETAQKLDAKLFQELRWRSIGPARGGRALAVTGVRGQPDVFYFGAVGGGVWRSDDAGRTWKPIFDSERIASIGAIAVAPSNPQIIYVGTGEADMRSDIAYGNGMYRSADGGKSWTHIGLEDSRQIARILVDPKDPEKVFVAALGHAYEPNSERGVFYSKDGGKKWKRVLFHDENTGAIDLTFEPGNPKTIFAALLQTRRPPWNIYPPSKGPGTGLYRSKDGGEHWEPLSGHGLPSEGLGRMGIAFAPSNPRRIYLIVDAKEGGLYRSDDGAENWQLVSDDKRIWGRGWYFCEVSVDPKDADTVYVPNTGLYRSGDGGKSFTVLKGAPGGDDYHQLWIDPDEPRRMILGSDQGAVVTRNGGETWSSWYNQPTGQFYHVATDNRFPYWVYGAQQDSGAAATPSRSKYRSLNFHDWRPIEVGDENGYVAPDPLNPEVVYGGFVTRQDLRNEQIVQVPPGLAQTEKLRRTWTLPLVFSPIDAHVLYFGSQILFRTTDGGGSWKAISPDLTREDPGGPSNLDATTAADAPAEKRRGVIYTIAPSSVQAGEIWAGTDDGQIQLTRDEGKAWSNITPTELTPWSKVTHIEASHFHAGTAYAAVDRHRLEDLHPYLYRTRDFGKSWQQASSGIPEGSFLNCVREDPLRKGLLYACTELGVYVSFNDGDSWQSLQLNMPAASIRDLVVHGDDLVVATHGRSFWILDDASPLRQMNPQVSAADLWLFKPATAYRVRPGSDQGTPVPMDEALAENPPEGAMVDYWLKDKARGPVELEIFDADGVLVRRFSSDDLLPKTNPKNLPIAMEWVREAAPLSAEGGMHRFVWDLHYELPKSVRRSFYGPAGVWSLPGNYMVKLTANGKSSSQALTVKMDPRISTAEDGLRQEFVAASRISARLGEVAAAQERAEDLQKQIAARKTEAGGNAEVSAALAELAHKIDEVHGAAGEEEFGFFGLRLQGGEPVTFHRVTSALTGLLMIVDGADAPPTADTRTAAEKWQAAGADVLGRWKAVDADLAAVNAALQKAKLQPLGM
ncbi:MAG: hypothetical protein JWO71_2987 [Candidatus Acidoferrum typicum]|nr:hypothetical protein [Candidatus Acidoferrum typicum]